VGGSNPDEIEENSVGRERGDDHVWRPSDDDSLQALDVVAAGQRRHLASGGEELPSVCVRRELVEDTDRHRDHCSRCAAGLDQPPVARVAYSTCNDTIRYEMLFQRALESRHESA